MGLIAFQRPEATHVAGYRRWQQLGRQVRKGSAGIAILAPVANRIKREDDNGEELEPLRVVRAFRTAWIFDIADTDGDPLPEICTRLLGDGPVDAFCKLQAVAGAMDFSVDITDIPGEINGFCDHTNHRIVVDGRLSPAQGIKTLAHELLTAPTDAWPQPLGTVHRSPLWVRRRSSVRERRNRSS